MKALRTFVVLLIAVTLFGFGKNDVEANESDYVYPITTESEDWFSYTVLEKCEMLRIDEQVLQTMTDEQLVHAIADYPYLTDIYALDSMKDGLQNFRNICDAFDELLSRDRGIQSFMFYSSEIISEIEKEAKYDWKTDFIKVALKDMVRILSVEGDSIKNSSMNRLSVQTPNGSNVTVTIKPENHTTATHVATDNAYVSTYGVVKVRTGSCKYNCHSYAWYSTASSNPYWMDNPSLYMTDGSYTCKYSGSVYGTIYGNGLSVGDRIYYAANTHSALFIDNPLNGAPLLTLRARSKWGQAGVFEHAVSNVPSVYNYSTVSIWH